MKALYTEYFLPLHSIFQFLILAGISIVVGVLLTYLLFHLVVSQYGRRSDNYISKSIRKHLGGRFRSLFPLLIFYMSLDLLQLSEEVHYGLAAVIRVLLVINIGWILLKLLNVLEDVFFERYKIRRNKYLKERKIRTQIQFLKKMITFLVIILGIAAILLSFEEVQKIGQTILTSTAIIGVIVGFASQKTIGNLISGFQIAFTQPIKIDDTVIVEGEWGVIEEITLTYVVVQVWDKRRLILPINYFITTPFQNWTRHTEDLVGEVRIHADYRLPLDPLRKELKKILDDHGLWDGKNRGLQVTDATDKTKVIRATVSADDSEKAWDLKCDVREGLIKFIHENYPEYLPRTRAEILGERRKD